MLEHGQLLISQIYRGSTHVRGSRFALYKSCIPCSDLFDILPLELARSRPRDGTNKGFIIEDIGSNIPQSCVQGIGKARMLIRSGYRWMHTLWSEMVRKMRVTLIQR